MRRAAAWTSAKLGTSIITRLQFFQLGDQPGPKIIAKLVARAVIETWPPAAADQAAIRRFAGRRQHALLEGHGKQYAHHRLQQMVVQPLLQAIGMDGAAAPGGIAENAGPVANGGANMR